MKILDLVKHRCVEVCENKSALCTNLWRDVKSIFNVLQCSHQVFLQSLSPYSPACEMEVWKSVPRHRAAKLVNVRRWRSRFVNIHGTKVCIVNDFRLVNDFRFSEIRLTWWAYVHAVERRVPLTQCYWRCVSCKQYPHLLCKGSQCLRFRW